MSDYSFPRSQYAATDPRAGQQYPSNGANSYSSSSYSYAQESYNAARTPNSSYPLPDGRYPSTNPLYSQSQAGPPKGPLPGHGHSAPPTHVGRSSYDYHHGRSPVSPHSPLGSDAHGYAPRGTSPYDSSSPTYSQYSQSYSPSHGYSSSQEQAMIAPYAQTMPLSSSPPYSSYASDYANSLPRAFTCDACPLSFHRQHDLKRHEKTHSGSKPYTCNGGCGKTFTRKDALKRHQLVKKCGTFDDSLN